MIHINDSSIIGQTFNAFDPTIDYTCIGYGQNDTLIIIGTNFDTVNNRSSVKSFKLSEVKFKGQLTPKI